MATQFKKDQVAALAEKIRKAQSFVLVNYQGITVNEETVLRRKMKESGSEYLIAKNKLFKIALKEAGVSDSFDDVLEGTTAFAFGYKDPIAPAKIVFELSKTKEREKIFTIKGGYLTGRKVEDSKVKELALLPSREQLLSMVLNGMLGPIRKLVYATVSIAEKKEAGIAIAE
ncbi:MAG: 50S ribosomal protein L10 [Fusobacteriaceae bacterium]|jgi:large subunit ribosomal protein L10|nr:50S ribosomal protein L10 [Fusobacteriaceae bacterium]